ncbi:hypothetical protein D3C87_1375020 [compost metagenome]
MPAGGGAGNAMPVVNPSSLQDAAAHPILTDASASPLRNSLSVSRFVLDTSCMSQGAMVRSAGLYVMRATPAAATFSTPVASK